MGPEKRLSSHLGARPGDGGENPGYHFWWQGKFYSRNGKDKRFPPLSVTGYGTGEGLCGWNCRHSFGPGDGVNNPFRDFDSEENQKEYELQQRQRALERRIRNTKRDVMGRKTALDSEGDSVVKSELEKEYQRKAALLQKQNKEYNDFCEENNLKKLQDRLQVAKWDRQQAAAASGAARKWKSAQKENGVIQEIKRTGALPKNAVVNLPARKVNIKDFAFDDEHINLERHHNVSRDQAIEWVMRAKISAKVWKGKYERFYSEDGATYVDLLSKTIRTAFSSSEYNAATRKMMEVLKENGY